MDRRRDTKIKLCQGKKQTTRHNSVFFNHFLIIPRMGNRTPVFVFLLTRETLSFAILPMQRVILPGMMCKRQPEVCNAEIGHQRDSRFSRQCFPASERDC